MRHQLNFIALVIVLVIYACEMKKGAPKKECVTLNDAGAECLTGTIDNHFQPNLQKAVQLFEEAIQCDSNYVIAYVNISGAYDQQHQYTKELFALDKVLHLTNNDPAILLEKAMLYERMNKLDSASKIYNLTEAEYNKRLAKQPNNRNLISGLIDYKAVTKGRKEAIDELDKQLKQHPALSSKLSYLYEIYRDFDRHTTVFKTVLVKDR